MFPKEKCSNKEFRLKILTTFVDVEEYIINNGMLSIDKIMQRIPKVLMIYK